VIVSTMSTWLVTGVGTGPVDPAAAGPIIWQTKIFTITLDQQKHNKNKWIHSGQYILRKIQTSDFKAKMHQIRFPLGILPIPSGGSLRIPNKKCPISNCGILVMPQPNTLALHRQKEVQSVKLRLIYIDPQLLHMLPQCRCRHRQSQRTA